jgi:hypothetical protein
MELGFWAYGMNRASGQLFEHQRLDIRSGKIGVLRMESPAAASAAVSSRLLDQDPGVRPGTPPKQAVVVPGFSSAIAFTESTPALGVVSTTAYLAYRQYVLFSSGSVSTDQARAYFTAQIDRLAGFSPTPIDGVLNLQLDSDSIARYTLPPAYERRTRTGGVPLAAAVAAERDLISTRKMFADYRVEAVGYGASTVFRVRDADAAKGFQDERIAEFERAHEGFGVVGIAGVPGAACRLLPRFTSEGEGLNWCTVQVGRYVAEFGVGQERQARQGIAASYLILKAAT